MAMNFNAMVAAQSSAAQAYTALSSAITSTMAISRSNLAYAIGNMSIIASTVQPARDSFHSGMAISSAVAALATSSLGGTISTLANEIESIKSFAVTSHNSIINAHQKDIDSFVVYAFNTTCPAAAINSSCATNFISSYATLTGLPSASITSILNGTL